MSSPIAQHLHFESGGFKIQNFATEKILKKITIAQFGRNVRMEGEYNCI